MNEMRSLEFNYPVRNTMKNNYQSVLTPVAEQKTKNNINKFKEK